MGMASSTLCRTHFSLKKAQYGGPGWTLCIPKGAISMNGAASLPSCPQLPQLDTGACGVKIHIKSFIYLHVCTYVYMYRHPCVHSYETLLNIELFRGWITCPPCISRAGSTVPAWQGTFLYTRTALNKTDKSLILWCLYSSGGSERTQRESE